MADLPRMPVPWRRPVTASPGTRVRITHVTDPLCPWAYSFEPVLRALEARYGDQVEFRTVLIGLVETVEESMNRGSSPEGRALSALRFRRFGMPITPHLRERVIASAPACRLVKAAERKSLAEARSPSQVAVALRRTARSDGPERYTAPTLVLSAADGGTAVVPGFQPLEAVEVALMNLEPRLHRLPPPEPVALLRTYPGGLTSQEVARVLADTTTAPDRGVNAGVS